MGASGQGEFMQEVNKVAGEPVRQGGAESRVL